MNQTLAPSGIHGFGASRLIICGDVERITVGFLEVARFRKGGI